MVKVAKILKNKLMVAAMLVVMVLGTMAIPSHAESVTTKVYGGNAAYNYYVRKSGKVDLLGIMRVARELDKNGKVIAVTNTFTAKTSCSKVTVWVSEKEDGKYNTAEKRKMVLNIKVISIRSRLSMRSPSLRRMVCLYMNQYRVQQYMASVHQKKMYHL